MANLYGAYKAGRKVMTSAYNANQKRLAGSFRSSTSSMFTGSGNLGANAGNVSSEVESSKNLFKSSVQSEKQSFTAELGKALSGKFESFKTNGGE